MHFERERDHRQCDAIMYHSRMKFLKTSRDNCSGGAVERGGLHAEPCTLGNVLPPVECMTRSQSFRYACWRNNQTEIKKQVRLLPSFARKVDETVADKQKEIFSRIRVAQQKQGYEKKDDTKAARKASIIVTKIHNHAPNEEEKISTGGDDNTFSGDVSMKGVSEKKVSRLSIANTTLPPIRHQGVKRLNR